jgi:hypothetical protein
MFGKSLLIVTLLLGLANFAHAQDDEYNREYAIKDKLGVLTIRLQNIGEPVYQPYLMSLAVKCSDRRVRPNAVEAKKVQLVTDKPICGFHQYSFDRDAKILTIHYSTSAFVPGEAKCDEHWAQDFDLNQLCAAWSDK